MTATEIEPNRAALSDCDREPIRTPEAIQPHGLLLTLPLNDGIVLQSAGDASSVLGSSQPQGRALPDLLNPDLAVAVLDVSEATSSYIGRFVGLDGHAYDVSACLTDDRRVVELERVSDEGLLAVERLAELDRAAGAFERARTLTEVCDEAARAFQDLTGFDRVMIYRFMEDESGAVLAEAVRNGLPSFLNQRFPASDIPRQARELYVRNRVRVIPDVNYTPCPLTPASEAAPLDMSESALRSVSPIHLRYMRNMGVGASASISIVMDGHLWGLIACHHPTARLMGRETRSAAAVLARGLARQLKGRIDAETYRGRSHARALEEEIVSALPLDGPIAQGLADRASQLLQLMDADGVAVVSGQTAHRHGACPPETGVREIAEWVRARHTLRPVTTRALSTLAALGKTWATEASGLAAFVTPGEETVLLWFRAEQIETVRWAGDPHAGVKSGPLEQLTPRASFDAWAETVRKQAAAWTPIQIESVARLRDALADFAAVRALRRQNLALEARVQDRDNQLAQQDYLLREVNHRVQNSLQLVSSFLALQNRDLAGAPGSEVLEEARRRVKAVSLVHSRLYRAEHGQDQTVDLARYLGDLVSDLGQSMGAEWTAHFTMDLTPMTVEAGRAVTVGLIFTELVINAQKYAYGGKPGPIHVQLELIDNRFRLQVSDAGAGGHQVGGGFGSRMVESMAGQLGGAVSYRSQGKDQGLTADLIAPARVDSQI